MSRIRTALVGTVAAGLLLMTANVASASEIEAPVTTTAREIGYSLGNGWYGNSPVTTTVSTDISSEVRDKVEETVETDVVKSTETQVVESTETNTIDASYTASVLPPINSDNSSVWPAKRGVIPVQFKVTESGKVEERSVSTPQHRSVTTVSERSVSTPYSATDVTTTDTTTKTPLFQSVCGSPDTNYSVIGLYDIPVGTTVEDIAKVQANFGWLEGRSAGGSLRWDIGTEHGDIHVYYGDSHSWTGPGGTGVNLMDATDDRFDDSNTSAIGGTFYNTKAQILTKLGDAKVNNVSLVVDSCWNGTNQRLNINSATVGINGVDSTVDSPLAPKTTTVSDTVEGEFVAGSPTDGPWSVIDVQKGEWISGTPTYGPWTEVSSTVGAVTNDPDAKLVVKKFNDGYPVEVLSETLTSAQADVGGNFRKIDHKYIYNLEASTLGKGDFKVYIQIDGVPLENHGEFTLR